MLNDVEVRVLGALIEKEIATPDNYPLSLNALMLACNQTSSRHPVMHLDESEVADAVESLREKRLVSRIERGESRVLKFRHVAYETMNWGRPAIAVMCILMLRGPQTVGEIRTRSVRLYDFTGLDEVEITLGTLAAGDSPFLVELPRQTGQKEVRFAHLLSGDVALPPPSEVAPAPLRESNSDRIEKIEQALEDLKRQFEEFRSRFE